MIHQQIKDLFYSSVEEIASDISQYAVHPDTDFLRNRKISSQKLISFLVSQGASSTKVEMLDFWGLNSSAPSSSALNQQRAKLKPDALEAVFKQFNSSLQSLSPSVLQDEKYRFLAADGSKGLAGNFDFPEEEFFDIDVRVTLVRSHSKKIPVAAGRYVRFIDKAAGFDYIEYGSHDTYEINFRIVSFPINDSA